MSCPKHFHELALNRIGQYLKSSSYIGLVLNPLSELKIDCHHGSGFSRIYGRDKSTDKACVNTTTGYFITISYCLVIW